LWDLCLMVLKNIVNEDCCLELWKIAWKYLVMYQADELEFG
jgi:hypothetical protein